MERHRAGGGVALLRAGKALDGLKLGGDQQVAWSHPQGDYEPLRWIATTPVRRLDRGQKVKDATGDDGYNAAPTSTRTW